MKRRVLDTVLDKFERPQAVWRRQAYRKHLSPYFRLYCRCKAVIHRVGSLIFRYPKTAPMIARTRDRGLRGSGERSSILISRLRRESDKLGAVSCDHETFRRFEHAEPFIRVERVQKRGHLRGLVSMPAISRDEVVLKRFCRFDTAKYLYANRFRSCREAASAKSRHTGRFARKPP